MEGPTFHYRYFNKWEVGRMAGIFIMIFLFALNCDCDAVEKEDNTNHLNLAEDTTCGEEVKDAKKASRILGGQVAAPGEFPFLASVQNKHGRHFCSAFIVKKQFLVSAAHCFIETMYGSEAYKHYEILVGANNWTDKSNLSNIFRIDSVTIHPEYSYLKPNVENDIAILKLNRPLEWGDRIRPICLATSKLAEQEFGVIAGWGDREEKQALKEWMQDTTLYKVSLPIWNNQDCQTEYKKHRINWNTKATHVCAGFQEMTRDTCQGDSGSPLVLQGGNGRKIAYGIVSMGEGCATRLPGIYTRVSSFLPWIQENS